MRRWVRPLPLVLALSAWEAAAHGQEAPPPGEQSGAASAPAQPGAESAGRDDAATPSGAPSAGHVPAVGAPSHEYGAAAATELFNAGRELMAAGRFAEACPKLAESARLDPHVGTLGKLAECEERLGRLVRARTYWQRAVNLARARGDDRLDYVTRELARVDTSVPKLRLVPERSLPAGASIRIDDLDLGPAATEVAIPLDPGRHVVTVAAPGKRPWTAAVLLKAGGATTSLPVPALKDAPAASPPVSSAPATGPDAPAAAPMRPLRIAGLVAGGLGAATLIAGTYFGIKAQSKLDQSNAMGCMGNQCPSAAAAVRGEARAAGDLSTGFFVAGGVLSAGGILLYVLGGAEAAPDGPVRASAGVAPSGGGLTLQGRF